MPIFSNGFLSFLILFSVSSSHHFLVSCSPSPSPVLHDKQTYNRPDPLSYFKSYHGGYNVRNSHYWASAAFTGVHGYAIAGIWIIGGLGFGIYVIVKYITCSNRSWVAMRQHSDCYYLIPFSVIILCTFLAIVASGLVLAANHKSLDRTNKLENTLLRVAKVARLTIRKVTRAIRVMRHLLDPYNEAASDELKLASNKLSSESHMILGVVNRHRPSTDKYIKIWYRGTAWIVSVNLVLVAAALGMLLLHWRPGFVMIIFLCWILTVVCWILTGFHYFLHTFAQDTCAAFEEYQHNPDENSLSSLLPCMDQIHADQIMIGIGSIVHKYISKLNTKITNLTALLGLDEQEKNAFSGFVKICNPFTGGPDYKYNPSGCPKNAIAISDIPDVLGQFTCYGEDQNVSCGVGKFVPKASYDMAFAYAQAIQELLDVLPDIEGLARCSFVRDTISDVLSHQCRPFRNSFRLSWLSILLLSTVMVILEMAWVAKGYQNRGRNFQRCSVIPS